MAGKKLHNQEIELATYLQSIANANIYLLFALANFIISIIIIPCFICLSEYTLVYFILIQCNTCVIQFTPFDSTNITR